MKDRDGDDFMIISLPSKYIQTDGERGLWLDYCCRQFSFPVVIAFGNEEDPEWTVEGQPRLLQILEGENIDDLPWQIVTVHSSEPPPISYDPTQF